MVLSRAVVMFDDAKDETDEGETRGCRPGSPVLWSALPGPTPGKTWMRLWPGETSWYCSRARRIAAALESMDLAWSVSARCCALMALICVVVAFELTLLVPDLGQREPSDQHDDGRHDGEGHHPTVAIASYRSI